MMYILSTAGGIENHNKNGVEVGYLPKVTAQGSLQKNLCAQIFFGGGGGFDPRSFPPFSSLSLFFSSLSYAFFRTAIWMTPV